MFDAFFETFFGAAGVFGEAGQAEKFRCTAVDHFFVNPDLVVRQLPSALFAARLRIIVIHIAKSYFFLF